MNARPLLVASLYLLSSAALAQLPPLPISVEPSELHHDCGGLNLRSDTAVALDLISQQPLRDTDGYLKFLLRFRLHNGSKQAISVVIFDDATRRPTYLG